MDLLCFVLVGLRGEVEVLVDEEGEAAGVVARELLAVAQVLEEFVDCFTGRLDDCGWYRWALSGWRQPLRFVLCANRFDAGRMRLFVCLFVCLCV